MALDAVPIQVVVGTPEADDPYSLIVRVVGELDMNGCARVEAQLVAAVATASSVVLDLAELTFCDSSGVGVFLVVRDKALAAGTSLVFCNVVGHVRRVFAVAGVDKIFDLSD